MKKVTAWYKYIKNSDTSKLVFNHIEDGWCKNDTPTIKVHGTIQDMWKSATWKKELGYLNDNNVYVYPKNLLAKIMYKIREFLNEPANHETL